MADPIYTSASPIAVNPADGELIGGALFTVHAPDDTSFSTPLAVTDPISGAAIAPLRSNVNGTLPAFKVTGDLPRVILKSGAFVTELVSLGGLVTEQVTAAGLDPATVASAIAAGGSATAAADAAAASAVTASDAASTATEKASAVESVVATNDGIMTSVAQDVDSAFRAELGKTIDSQVDAYLTANPVEGILGDLVVIEDPAHPGFGMIVVESTPDPVTAPTIVTTSLGGLTQGVAVSRTIATTGDAPIQFIVASGTIPAGLSLSPDGVIGGVPSVPGAYSFTLTALNAVGSDDQVFTGSITAAGSAPTITLTSLGVMSQGAGFSATVTYSGDTATFAVTAGSLPAGLTLSSAGVLSGVPSGSGAYSFTVTATNAFGSDPQAYAGTIAASAGGVLARTPSFGPNGTHYPARTPWVGESAWDSDVEVACTWLAIGTAIQTAATNFPNGKCRIRVQPGTLPGGNAGSTSTPVLANIGALGRTHRILVVPRDGAFTVSHAASWRIHNVKGVSFVGFSGWGLGVAEGASTGGVLTNCQDLAWAWSKIRFVNVISQAAGESADIDLVEVVAPDQALRSEDRMAFRNDAGSVTRRVFMDGCYLAPNYKVAGSSAHCDTLQTSGNSEVFEDVTLRDTAVFASTNAAIITTTPTDLNLVHSAVIGGFSAPVRYPAPAEANQFTSGVPITINGAAASSTAVDSIITGKIVPVMTSVSNTRVSAAQSSVPLSGSYTVVSGLMDSTAKIDAEIPYPNDTLLQAAWTAL